MKVEINPDPRIQRFKFESNVKYKENDKALCARRIAALKKLLLEFIVVLFLNLSFLSFMYGT